jgi:DNA-binding transcriptional regulator YbjK
VPSVTPSPPGGEPSPRRRALLAAAVEVVADEGLRGLTHRAVDRRAGLPEGTCSAYLRTRQALQVAVAEHVAATLAADVDALGAELAEAHESAGAPGPDDQTEALERTRVLFERWLRARTLVVARLELSLEATRNPAVAEVLAQWRARLVEIVAGILSRAGKPHSDVRAEALVAAFDGLLLAAQLKPASQRRRFLSESLAMVLAGVTGVPGPAPQ